MICDPAAMKLLHKYIDLTNDTVFTSMVDIADKVDRHMAEPEEGDTPLVESKQIVDSSKEAGVGVGVMVPGGGRKLDDPGDMSQSYHEIFDTQGYNRPQDTPDDDDSDKQSDDDEEEEKSSVKEVQVKKIELEMLHYQLLWPIK